MLLITDFELVNHGVRHPQEFEGCGVSNTNFFGVVTGQGDSEFEAYEDACEILASNLGGVEFNEMDKAAENFSKDVSLTHSEERGESYEESPWHYISIRYNLPKVQSPV